MPPDSCAEHADGKRVDLTAYLHDYALRRYGRESAARMAKVLDVLARTVYATKDMTQPLYCHQVFTVFDFPNASVYAPPEQVAWTPDLRKALEMALKEAVAQKGNGLYERDIVDIARRYLGDLFNGIVPNVIYAWRDHDSARLGRTAQDAATVLEETEGILASSPQYRLDERVRPSAHLSDHVQRVRQSRNVMSIWEGSANLDYPRRDEFAELLHGYYLPRLKAWAGRLESVSPESWSQADDDWLTKTYWDIGKKWVEEGASLPVAARSTADEIRRALDAAREFERHCPRGAARPRDLEFDEGTKGWSLSARRMNIAVEAGAGPNGSRAVSFRTWPDSSGGNLYLFQTLRSRSPRVELDCRVEPCGESAFAGLRVEGYDKDFRRVVECTYQWGDAWNYWPDRYRPDNATPDWTIGATGFLWWWVGHYTIKQRLGPGSGKWEHLAVTPEEDVDKVHGAGTWDRLGVRNVRVALIASTRRKEDPVSGAFANVAITP